MATRHQARESVIALLYAEDIGNENIKKFLDDILEDKKIRNKQKEFALGLYRGVEENLGAIDKEINKHLKELKINEIGNIERAILRLGAYEILYSDLDDVVAINEAIELAKLYGAEGAYKLINRSLDKIAQNLRSVELSD